MAGGTSKLLILFDEGHDIYVPGMYIRCWYIRTYGRVIAGQIYLFIHSFID